MTLGYVNRLGGVTAQLLGIDQARATEQVSKREKISKISDKFDM
jgi:hypothetical protein